MQGKNYDVNNNAGFISKVIGYSYDLIKVISPLGNTS
jgi:hypothetical protein